MNSLLHCVLHSATFRFVGNCAVLRVWGVPLVVGPHWPGVVVSFASIAGGTMLNLSVISRSSYPNSVFLHTFVLVMATFISLFLFLTAVSDPGLVVLQRLQPAVEFDGIEFDQVNDTPDSSQLSTGCGLDEDEDEEEFYPRQSKGKKSTALHHPVEESDDCWCDICDVSQGARSRGVYHCPDCNTCIEGHDHHCPWMGKCIGKRNMAMFCCFILCLCFYIFELCVVGLFL